MPVKVPISKNRSNFKLYLEGIQLPFSSITISESEGAFPSAQVTLPATLKCLRILPGTIVQLAGPHELSSHVARQVRKSTETVLLFEGEVVAMGYQKQANGRAVQLSCASVLHRFEKAKAIAVDSIAPRLHRNAQMVVTNVNGPFNTLNTKKAKNSQPKTITEPTNPITDLKLVDRFGGITYTAIQALNELLPHGNINKIVQQIVEMFNKTDYYWHVTDVSLRVKSSITAFPNKQEDSLSQILIEETKALITKMRSGSLEAESYTLYSVLWAILEVLRYQSIAPAAPTGGTQVSGSSTGEKGKFEPLRLFFTPDLDTCPPALCNVFFPDDIASFSYNRSFLAEPTRSLTFLDWNVGAAGQIGEYGINYVIPDMSIQTVNYQPPEGEPVGSYIATYTPEEAYQGCRPIFAPVNAAFVDAAHRWYDQGFRATEDMTNDEKDPNFSKALKNEALKVWMSNKYGKSRSVQIQCDWNPNRIVGVPGLIIDDGFPSLVGVVQNIQSTISANGQASSAVTFRSVRVVYDEDSEAYLPPTESIYPHALRVTDNEIFPTLNDFLYMSDLYSHTEVGRDVYSYMVLGTKPSSGGGKGQTKGALEKFASDSPSTWNVNPSLYSDVMEEPALYDQSILNYLRSADSPDAMGMPVDMEDKDGNDSPEETYSKRIYLAIKKIKDEWKAMQGGEGIQRYLTNLNYRQLTPMKDYLGYIQATNADGNKEYKDSIHLMANDDTAADTFQTLLDNAHSLDEEDLPAIPNGSILKSLKLDHGLDAKIPTTKDLKELIAKLKIQLTEEVERKINKIEEEVSQLHAAQAPQVAGTISHTIGSGQSLSQIAAEYGVSISEILEWNHGNPAIESEDIIFAGQSITINGEPDANALESLAKEEEELRSTVGATFDEAIEIIQNKIDDANQLLTDISNGITPAPGHPPEDLRSIYKPYDETRRAHVKIAFSELRINEGDVNITK